MVARATAPHIHPSSDALACLATRDRVIAGWQPDTQVSAPDPKRIFLPPARQKPVPTCKQQPVTRCNKRGARARHAAGGTPPLPTHTHTHVRAYSFWIMQNGKSLRRGGGYLTTLLTYAWVRSATQPRRARARGSNEGLDAVDDALHELSLRWAAVETVHVPRTWQEVKLFVRRRCFGRVVKQLALLRICDGVRICFTRHHAASHRHTQHKATS